MKKSEKKKKIIGVVLVILLLANVLPSTAWFKIENDKKVNTDQLEIIEPYRLYLKDEKATQTFSLSIGNLHPGETKEVVFCVTSDSGDGEPSSVANYYYELELIRTENIPLNYRLFSVTKEEHEFKKATEYTVDSGFSVDVTEERLKEVFPEITGSALEKIINKGKYTKYYNASEMQITSTTSEYDYDYYLLEITLLDNVLLDDYKKETDLIYLKGTAIQETKVKETE